MATDTLSGTVSAQPHQRVLYKRLLWVGPLAIVASTVANLVVRSLAVASLPISPDFMPLSTSGPTIFFTVVGVLLAVLVFGLVGRFSARPARTYTIIAVVALLLSFFPNVMMLLNPADFPFDGITTSAVVVLMLQHVVAAVVAVWILITQAIEG